MKQWLCIVLLNIACMSFAQHSSIDWESDIQYLKTEFPNQHYSFRQLNNTSRFFNMLEKLRLEQEQLTDIEIVIRLQQAIALLGDSHSGINSGPFVKPEMALPIKLLWCSDGLFVLYTTPTHEEILGKKLTHINGYPLSDIIDSLSSVITIENEASRKKQVPNLIPYLPYLNYFGFADTYDVTLTLEDENGKTLEHTMTAERMERANRVMCEFESVPWVYKNERSYFVDRYIEQDHIYHVLYNKCMSREFPPMGFKGNRNTLPSFTDFLENVTETIDQKSPEKVIIDLRFNAGGNSSLGNALVDKLASNPNVNKDGTLFVILGRTTFSSAILNVMSFKKETKAIFVGEETSGKPNHFGEVRYFKLPSSKLVVYYSTNYFKRTDEDLQSIMPDVVIEPSFDDFKKGIDPVYEWIKKQ